MVAIKESSRPNDHSGKHFWHQLSFLRTLTPSQATKKLEDYSQLEIYCVYFLCPDKQIKKILENFALKWRWIKPFTDGLALQKRGLKTGPAFSRYFE